MHLPEYGLVVQLADLSERAVPEGRSYSVGDDGSLVVSDGIDLVARIPAGDWIRVWRVGQLLRPTWPPDDLERLLDDVAQRLVVGQGWGFRLVNREPFRHPRANDREAFVDLILGEEGDLQGYATDSRVTADRVVRTVFGLGDR